MEPKHFETLVKVLAANHSGAARIVAQQYGQQAAARNPHTEFDNALCHLTARPRESVGRISAAFRELVELGDTDAVFERLPRILYALLRHSSETHLVEIVHSVINPFLGEFRKKVSLEPVVKTATIATLACAINEGGGHDLAIQAFTTISKSLPDPRDRRFGWVTMMTVRAKAHAHGWKRSAAPADYEIHRASEDRSETNVISMVNTRAEIELAFGRAQRAWAVTQPAWFELMRKLNENYDVEVGLVKRGKQPLARPHHQYATLVFAILAATAQSPCALTNEQLDHSVAFANALGPQTLGRLVQVKITPEHLGHALANRIARIEQATLHPRLTKPRQHVLVNCLNTLAQVVSD